MSDRSTRFVSSLSCAAVMLASGVSVAADLPSSNRMESELSRQFARHQDQTQFENRQRLEQRINGSGGETAAQNRNRYRYEQRTHGRSQSWVGGGQRNYGSAGSVPGGRGTGQSAPGRRMAETGGGRR